MTEKKLQFNFENEESQKAFVTKYNELVSNPEVQNALKNVKSPEETLEVLLKFSPNENTDEVRKQFQNMKTQIDKELSDNDLESVAGGISDSTKDILKIVGVAVGGATAIAAAAFGAYKMISSGTKDSLAKTETLSASTLDLENALLTGM